jgi:hypothetical protein
MQKKNITLAVMAIIGIIIISSLYNQPPKANTGSIYNVALFKTDTFIVIAWNDLGMHCANKYFGNMCILPPYNNQHAQVIKVGSLTSLPQIMTTGMKITYEIPGNTYSVGKTDFWTYASSLFGVSLPNDTGLTGVGLSGIMNINGNFFHIEGIPVTPYPDSDLVYEHPFQLTLMKLYDTGNNLLASTQSVIPVSNEINCISSGCHTSEQNILDLHESVAGFDPTVKPILCANCHQDNALGMSGTAGTPVFSEAVHNKHGGITNDCYKCHPGPNTQCFRDIMKTNGMVCQDCHGSVSNVGQTISDGRQAWLEEPDCGIVACHGPVYAPEPGKLFRNSTGHSGLFCSVCHGSPHAILPTNNANDNIQNLTLQGYTGTLNKCIVCHGVNPTGPGPHGLYVSVISYDSTTTSVDELMNIYPNPVISSATIPFVISEDGKVTLALYDMDGKCVRKYLDQTLQNGSYSVKFEIGDLANGVYYCLLKTTNSLLSRKIIIAF